MPAYAKAQVTQAKNDERAIHPSAEIYLVDNPGRCPTPAVLVHAKLIPADTSMVDPWGSPYVITCKGDEPCKGDETAVASAGPDKKLGTHDDIRVPERE